MKQITLLLIMFSYFEIVFAQKLDDLNKDDYSVYFNEAYGNHERNKFDIITPKNDSLHGLVIFIHGGGFKHGDKNALYRRVKDIKCFLDNNIAVATINYRFYSNTDSLGVRVSLDDIQRAIQYLRHNASKFNIDKERVGCYGISAGAGSSLYFAFHDDLAIEGDSTLLGESTRLRCAGAISTQATYDVFKWKGIVPYMRLVILFKRKQIYNAAANFYGYPNYKSYKNQIDKDSEDLDMLSMIDHQDPPIYLINLTKGYFPKNDDIVQHHRKHAVVVSKLLSKKKVENYLYTSKKATREEDVDFQIREFMIRHLVNKDANQ